MSTSYSSNSYSSDTMEADLQRFRLTVLGISLLVQVVGAAIIYGFIKCCCPTSLRRVRPGLILSGDISCSIMPTVQPIVIQNVVPTETMQLGAYQPMSPPPAYPECRLDDAAIGDGDRQAPIPK